MVHSMPTKTNKFRTNIQNFEKLYYFCQTFRCPGGEMVDALVSGASALRHVGSSPILGTQLKKRNFRENFPLFYFYNFLITLIL